MKTLRTGTMIVLFSLSVTLVLTTECKAESQAEEQHPAIVALKSLPCENGSGGTLDAYLRDTLVQVNRILDPENYTKPGKKQLVYLFTYNLISETPTTTIVEVRWWWSEERFRFKNPDDDEQYNQYMLSRSSLEYLRGFYRRSYGTPAARREYNRENKNSVYGDYSQRYVVDVIRKHISPMRVVAPSGEKYPGKEEGDQWTKGGFVRFGEWCELKKALGKTGKSGVFHHLDPQ